MFLVLLRRLSRCASSAEKLNVISTPIAVQTVLVIRSSHFTFQFRLMTDLRLVIKMRETRFSGSANLFKEVNVIDIRTKWFGNFPRVELSRVSLSHGRQKCFDLSGVSRNRGFEKSGVKL